ncbi:DMT family transporter [Streptomyces sp. NPDC050504]|uniref:DMT family transporter n=1 Tax=Streptomyces sp. NPDC050504 TaxID=3365618 RepID=UPI0037874667
MPGDGKSPPGGPASPTEAATGPSAPGSRWAPATLAGVSAVWGANYTVNAWGLRDFTVIGFNALRFLLAAPLLIALTRRTEGALRVDRGHWPRLLLSSAVGMVGYQLAFTAAVRLTLPATAAVLIALSPFFTAVFARLAGERSTLPTSRAVTAGTVAFAGVVLVVLGTPTTNTQGQNTWYGTASALLAAALWGWYPVITRPLLTHHSALRITAWTSTAGAAALLPLAAATGFTQHAAIAPRSWFALAYSVALVTVAGLVLWYRAVARAGSAPVMLWMFAVPVTAALFAALTGEQPLTPPQAAGSAAVLLALAHAQRPAPRPTGGGTPR